jgi:acyl-CoA thioesterase FadM
MNMHLRLGKIILRGFLRKEHAHDAEIVSVLSMRVWPMDLDANLHQNNGRYLSCMDLGRFDIAFLLGLHRPMFKQRWQPLLGSSTIRYRKSLVAFQRFELMTTIAGWDEKWVFMQQAFLVEKETIALGATKVLFRDLNGNVPTQKVLDHAKITTQSPELPQWILDWHHCDQALGAQIKYQN